MQLPQIQISQQNAQIGLQTEYGNIRLRQSLADMQIRQTPANIVSRTEHGMMHIDQSQAFAEAGLKSVFQMTDEYAAKGKQSALRSIARRSQDGDRMRDIRSASNPFVEFAKRTRNQKSDFNINFIPSYGSVKFQYQPTRTDVQVRPHQVSIDVRTRMPDIQHSQGAVRTYLAQKNWIQFDVSGAHVNTRY